jgi:hypothetical protein
LTLDIAEQVLVGAEACETPASFERLDRLTESTVRLAAFATLAFQATFILG